MKIEELACPRCKAVEPKPWRIGVEGDKKYLIECGCCGLETRKHNYSDNAWKEWIEMPRVGDTVVCKCSGASWCPNVDGTRSAKPCPHKLEHKKTNECLGYTSICIGNDLGNHKVECVKVIK
jgi:hypothetical protein